MKLLRKKGGPVRRRCGVLMCIRQDASLSEGMHNE